MQKKVAKLAETVNKSEERVQAEEALRMLIEKIILTPGPSRGEMNATALITVIKYCMWLRGSSPLI